MQTSSATSDLLLPATAVYVYVLFSILEHLELIQTVTLLTYGHVLLVIGPPSTLHKKPRHAVATVALGVDAAPR